jgi:hypothetical protein
MAQAKRAAHLAGDLLKSTIVDGVEYWMVRDAPHASSARLPILLLPPFDEYTVAYADRSIAVAASMLRPSRNGLAPGILIDGLIAGTWKRTLLAHGAVAVTPQLLRKLNRKEQTGLARVAERYAAFLGRKLTTVDKRRQPATLPRKGKR